MLIVAPASTPAHAAPPPKRLPSAPSLDSVAPQWRARARRAQRAAVSRSGNVGWVLLDERGRPVAGWRIHRRFYSASVVKAMLLECYLRDPEVRDRALTGSERARLGAMITRSDDDAANWAYGAIRRSCLPRLARQVGMSRFETGSIWGLSRITPYGTANLFFRIDQRIPRRHRGDAVRWLRGIVPAQRWGLAREAIVPPGMTIAFKGGFAGVRGLGMTISQGALLTTDGGGPRLAIAVLSNGNPSASYGHETIERIGRPLLRRWRPSAAAARTDRYHASFIERTGIPDR
jgi:hypothetical protein